MATHPEIIVQPFDKPLDDFKKYAREFSSSSNEYRGYDKLVELVEAYDASQYDLYEAHSDGETAGVAAVRLEDNVLYFDVFTVAAGFREIGVGDTLFGEIIKNEKYASAKSYESMALPGDRSTKNFFEQRQGKARLLIVGGPIVRTSEPD